MPINGHGQNMLGGASNGLLNVCVNNATSASNIAKVLYESYIAHFFFSVCLNWYVYEIYKVNMPLKIHYRVCLVYCHIKHKLTGELCETQFWNECERRN